MIILLLILIAQVNLDNTKNTFCNIFFSLALRFSEDTSTALWPSGGLLTSVRHKVLTGKHLIHSLRVNVE